MILELLCVLLTNLFWAWFWTASILFFGTYAVEVLLDLPVEPQIPNQNLDLLDKLRLLIQRIIEETANLPNLANSDCHGRSSRRLNEPNFTNLGPGLNEKDYENYLANNNFDEVITSYQSRNFQYQDQDLISSGIHSAGSDFENSSNNSKIDETTLHSGDFCENTNNLDKYTSELNSTQSSLESMSCLSRLSDAEDNQESYGAHRRQRIPDILSSETNENELWKSNWLLSPSPNHRLTPSPVPMLIPSPTGDCRTMIGDVDVEDILDLSENDSVEDDSEDSVESEEGYETIDVPTILVKSRTVIGGKDPLIQELTNHGDPNVLSNKKPVNGFAMEEKNSICKADIKQLIYELNHNLDDNDQTEEISVNNYDETRSIEVDGLHLQNIVHNWQYNGEDNQKLGCWDNEKFEKINNNDDYVSQKEIVHKASDQNLSPRVCQDSDPQQDKPNLSKHGLVNVYVNGEKIDLEDYSGTQIPVYDYGYQNNVEWKKVLRDTKPDPPKSVEVNGLLDANVDTITNYKNPDTNTGDDKKITYEEIYNAGECDQNIDQVNESKEEMADNDQFEIIYVNLDNQEINEENIKNGTGDLFESEIIDVKCTPKLAETIDFRGTKCEYTPASQKLIANQIIEIQPEKIEKHALILDNEPIKLSGKQEFTNNSYDKIEDSHKPAQNSINSDSTDDSSEINYENGDKEVSSNDTEKGGKYRAIKIVPYVPILDEEVDLSFLLKRTVILSDENIAESDDSKPDTQKLHKLPEFSTLTKSKINTIAQALNADILVNNEPEPEKQTVSLQNFNHSESSSDNLSDPINIEVVSSNERLNVTEMSSSEFEENTERKDELEEVEPVKFVPGSIAEREHMKWQNAAPILKNPYSIEELNKRLENTRDSVIDFQVRSHSLDETVDKSFNENSNEQKQNGLPLQIVLGSNPSDFKRYGRDYYVNEAKKASGTKKQRSVDENMLTAERIVATLPSQNDTATEKVPIELYSAKPIIIIEHNDQSKNQNSEFDNRDDSLIEILQADGDNNELYKKHATPKNLNINIEEQPNDLKIKFDDLKAKFDKEESKFSGQNTKITNKNHKYSNEKAIFDPKIKQSHTGDLYEAQFMPKFQLRNKLTDANDKIQYSIGKISNSTNDLDQISIEQKSNLNKTTYHEKQFPNISQNTQALDKNSTKIDYSKQNLDQQPKQDLLLEQTIDENSGLANGPSVKELAKKFLSSRSFIGQPNKKFMHQKFRRSSENLVHARSTPEIWPPSPRNPNLDTPRFNNEVHSLTARNLSKEFRENLKTPKYQ